MSNTTSASTIEQHLTFIVADEEYALGILRVKEIIEFDVLTKIPSAPPSVRGVINLRGNVVPVIDIALKIGLAETQTTKWTCIVIVEILAQGETTIMGLMVDSVSQVIDIATSDIEPPPSFVTQGDYPIIAGMARTEKKFILLLDVDNLLIGLDALTLTPVVENEGASASPSEASLEGVGG